VFCCTRACVRVFISITPLCTPALLQHPLHSLAHSKPHSMWPTDGRDALNVCECLISDLILGMALKLLAGSHRDALLAFLAQPLPLPVQNEALLVVLSVWACLSGKSTGS
jgi:hypothetical protein